MNFISFAIFFLLFKLDIALAPVPLALAPIAAGLARLAPILARLAARHAVFGTGVLLRKASIGIAIRVILDDILLPNKLDPKIEGS